MSKASQIRQKAQELLQKGHVEKAIQEYRRLITIESKNPNLYNELGDIYLRASDRDQAIQNYEKAAVIYEKVALYNNAVAVCKKILRVDPEKAETIMKLAELRAKQKLEGEATAFFAQYVECVLTGPRALVQRSQRDADRMLELMPANEGILSKAVKIYAHIGMKIKAIELCGKLIRMAEASGGGSKGTSYRRKIEELKSGLTPEEVSQVSELEGASGGASAPESADEPVGPADSMGVAAGAGEEIPAESAASDPSAAPDAGVDTGADVEPEAEGEEAATAESSMEGAEVEEVAEPGTEAEAATAADPEVGPAARGEAGIEAEERSETEPAADARGGDEALDAAEAEKDVARTDEPSRDARRETAGQPPARAAAPREAPRPGAAGAFSPQAGPPEATELAEEITSDVEQDDLRSHYDLGMAYLEMGLYTDSIRDFQVASRCEELRVSAMEMIGYCFLKSGQARLAVKQLQRTLEIARATGADALGIHYNLGLAYELIGEDAHAREHFEEVYIIDMAFRDVAEKMKKLSAVS